MGQHEHESQEGLKGLVELETDLDIISLNIVVDVC